jgi:KRAB domain-containing zinc finger protein
MDGSLPHLPLLCHGTMLHHLPSMDARSLTSTELLVSTLDYGCVDLANIKQHSFMQRNSTGPNMYAEIYHTFICLSFAIVYFQKSSNHPHICSFCNKPCTSRSNLVMHENWHRGKYNYECQYCGKKFMSTTSLKGHLPAHTGVKEFKCNLCSQEYKYKIQLKKHLLDAHQIESPRERRTKKLLGH